MPYVPDFDVDVFVSYATANNQRMNDDSSGWVTSVRDAVKSMLDEGLGRRGVSEVWMDYKLRGNEPFDEALRDKVSGSAVMLVFLSSAYLESEWCRRELEIFSSANSGERGRIFLIHYEPVPSDHWPVQLKGLSSEQYRLYQQERDGAISKPLGYPIPKPDNNDHQPFYDRLLELRRDLTAKLKDMKRHAEKTEIELIIDTDWNSFSDKDQRHLFRAIKEICQLEGKIALVGKRKGSVRLRIRVSDEDAKRILQATEDGRLQSLGVTNRTTAIAAEELADLDTESHEHLIESFIAEELLRAVCRELNSRKEPFRSLRARLIDRLTDQSAGDRDIELDFLRQALTQKLNDVMAVLRQYVDKLETDEHVADLHKLTDSLGAAVVNANSIAQLHEQLEKEGRIRIPELADIYLCEAVFTALYQEPATWTRRQAIDQNKIHGIESASTIPQQRSLEIRRRLIEEYFPDRVERQPGESQTSYDWRLDKFAAQRLPSVLRTAREDRSASG